MMVMMTIQPLQVLTKAPACSKGTFFLFVTLEEEQQCAIFMHQQLQLRALANITTQDISVVQVESVRKFQRKGELEDIPGLKPLIIDGMFLHSISRKLV